MNINRLGETAELHGTLSDVISQVSWAHEIPEADDGILRKLKVTLTLAELEIPEGYSRVDVFL